MEQDLILAPFPKPSRVAVIGAGLVGSTYAYTILLQGLADEICLIDLRKDKARGEAMDLNHAMPFTRRASVWAGTMQDLEDADVIMIAAGAAQKPGQSRMDLLRENAAIVGDIAEEAGRIAPGAVFLVTTNPVDLMSYVTMKRSNASPSRVIGSGTALDTARLRFLMGAALGVDPRSIHAFVLGEHGDSEMVAWSRAQVAGTGIGHWPEMSEDDQRSIEDDVKSAAYQVIRMKGATCYAIGLVLAKITEAILRDSRTVFSVSTYLTGEYGIYDVYLGIPAIVGRGGVLRNIEIPLPRDELERLQDSGRIVRDAVESLGLGKRKMERELAGAGASAGASLRLARFEAAEEAPPGGPLLPRSARRKRGMRKPRPL